MHLLKVWGLLPSTSRRDGESPSCPMLRLCSGAVPAHPGLLGHAASSEGRPRLPQAVGRHLSGLPPVPAPAPHLSCRTGPGPPEPLPFPQSPPWQAPAQCPCPAGCQRALGTGGGRRRVRTGCPLPRGDTRPRAQVAPHFPFVESFLSLVTAEAAAAQAAPLLHALCLARLLEMAKLSSARDPSAILRKRSRSLGQPSASVRCTVSTFSCALRQCNKLDFFQSGSV